MARVCLLYYLGMWIYEKHKISSKKSPDLTLERLFGKWKLNTGYTHQTAPYTNKMWRSALKKLPIDFAAKNILLLGLGGGGMIPILKAKYPRCSLAIVEWDPVMLDVSKKMGGSKILEEVEIVIDDALSAITLFKKLDRKFDLIILDLFEGQKVATVTENKEFFFNIAAIAKEKGFFLANIFREPEKSAEIEKHFDREKIWKFKYNTLSLYSSKERNNLPGGYFPYRNIHSFLEREFSSGWVKILALGKVWGTSHDIGPIRLERYLSNVEPEIFPSDKFRFIIWQTISPISKPVGWKKSWGQFGIKRTGFAEIKNQQEYWEEWEPHAQRHRKKWLTLKDKEWELITPSMEEFITAYKKIKFDPVLKGIFISLLKKKMEKHGDLVHLFAARKIGGQIEAGFACVDVPEGNQSYHLIAFHSKDAKKDSIGTGLMDEWFKRSISKGYRFLDFCVFWAPGEDKKWKGFSRFKSQFGVQFIDYPKPLIKFVKANKKA